MSSHYSGSGNGSGNGSDKRAAGGSAHDSDRTSSGQKRRKVREGSSPLRKFCDTEGHYLWMKGETLSGNYSVVRQMGEGTFGKVLECVDQRKGRQCAIKIVRNVEKYREAAMIEINILEDLRGKSLGGTHFEDDAPFVQLWDWFDYRGHVCMVFEPLGTSLYDFLSKNDYQGFPPRMVQNMARELLHGVMLMHERRRLCHTDLKPENILLVSEGFKTETIDGRNGRRKEYRMPDSDRIKLIDFGSATYEDQHHTSVVCTRHYRPPEVVLGLGWSYPCDIWSIGCIILEMYTGEALFQTHDNLEHMALMEAVLDKSMPKHLVRSARGSRNDRHACKYFHKDRDRLYWPKGAKNRDSEEFVEKIEPVAELISRRHDDLYDLVMKLLRFEPERRLTASEALKHKYFQKQL